MPNIRTPEVINEHLREMTSNSEKLRDLAGVIQGDPRAARNLLARQVEQPRGPEGQGTSLIERTRTMLQNGRRPEEIAQETIQGRYPQAA
jgi:hypothetical protein